MKKEKHEELSKPHHRIQNVKFILNGWKTIFWSTRILTSIITLLFIAQITSCASKDTSEETAAERSAPQEQKELPPSFLTAYNLFQSDSLEQIRHIQFPLSGKAKSGKDTLWQAKDWSLHQAFNSGSDLFRRNFRMLGNTLILEDIVAPKLKLHMQRRWKKQDSTWVLIYYQELQ